MQQIKSILFGWIETSRLCLSFNKVSWVSSLMRACPYLVVHASPRQGHDRKSEEKNLPNERG